MSVTSSILQPLPYSGADRGIPPLKDGERLSQPEFHRRYAVMPLHIRAELIGGIVYRASPLRMPHGAGSFNLSTVLGIYQAATPGLEGMDNTTAIMGPKSEPQPDLALRLLPDFGDQTRQNDEQYLVGAPEFIIEVAHSTKAVDLHQKKEDYRKAKVREYLVFCIEEKELRAFDLIANKPLPASADGVFRSKLLPGLWIDVPATFANNAKKMLRTARAGLRSPEHAVFVKRLKAISPPPPPKKRRKG